MNIKSHNRKKFSKDYSKREKHNRKIDMTYLTLKLYMNNNNKRGEKKASSKLEEDIFKDM